MNPGTLLSVPGFASLRRGGADMKEDPGYYGYWPYRLKAFEDALEYITGHSDVWVTTGREIARH